MADPLADEPQSADESEDGVGPDANDDELQAMDQLRDLLFGTERVELQTIQRRLDDPELKAVDVSQALPEAVRLCEERDGALSKALTPVVEGSLRTSIASNLNAIADALYPVIGPAIRRSITAALQQFIESTNQVIEQTFTAKGLSWRIEAFRTGLPIGEVALRHSLVYRVEQLFLINREDGVPLLHVAHDPTVEANEDLVAGMLTAIQDFARDSFENVKSADGLDGLQMGELAVMIEEGPKAVLAAVVRGTPPGDLRGRLQRTLESVHVELASEFEDSRGDTSAFEPGKPLIAEALEEQLRESPGDRSNTKAFLVLGVLALGILALLGWRLVTSWRHDRFLAALDQVPGVVLISAETSWSGVEVLALRDPQAQLDVEALARDASLTPDSIRLRLEPYLATEPSLVLARARSALAPPAGVQLRLDGDRLIAEGSASSEWAHQARLLARVVPGVGSYVDSALAEQEPGRLAAALATLAESRVEFHARSAQPKDPQVLASLANALCELAVAEQSDRRHTLWVVSEGPIAATQALSQARWTTFLAQLRAQGAPGRLLEQLRPPESLGDSLRFGVGAPQQDQR